MRPAECVASDVVKHYKADDIPASVAVIEARDVELVDEICQLVGRHAEAGLVRLIRHKFGGAHPECGGCRGPDCEGCGQSSHWYWWWGGEKPQTK